MQRTRRDTLTLVGTVVTAVLGGCVESGGDGAAESPTLPASETGTEQTATDGGTPATDGLPDDLDRVDTPPYEIEALECDVDGSGEGDRDPLYLCANMSAEPSLSFTQASTRGTLFADEGLQLGDDANTQLYATLIADEADLDRFADDGDAYDLAAETEFDTHAVLVVQTGWGSGSIVPHIKRVEETDTGVHAFGCYTQPCVYTDDYTARSAVVRFARPETLTGAVVSLTADPETRYNVAAGEGVVTIEGEP